MSRCSVPPEPWATVKLPGPLNVIPARLDLDPFRLTVLSAAVSNPAASPGMPRSPGAVTVEPNALLVQLLASFHDAFTAEFQRATPGKATVSLPETEPLVATTVAEPSVEGGPKTPSLLIAPPPSSDHAKAGWLASALPNWSRAVAEKGSVPSAERPPAGTTVMLVSVWSTVTSTLLVVASPPISVIVTWNV